MPYTIAVTFEGGLTASQRSIFELAANRWSEIIVADVPSVSIDGHVIDDLEIGARGSVIDGSGGILGRAGPTHVRTGSQLPIKGVMEFDTSDLDRMEAEGSLENVIIHEMGHVIGIGTIWHALGLVAGAGSANPTFVGEGATREFARLLDIPGAVPVPLANTGGTGTREGHWRETVFNTELMTGFIDSGANPLSRLTLAALSDLGYGVDENAADHFVLPSSLDMALRGIGADHPKECCCACGPGQRFGAPIVVPESAFVKRRKKSKRK